MNRTGIQTVKPGRPESLGRDPPTKLSSPTAPVFEPVCLPQTVKKRKMGRWTCMYLLKLLKVIKL